MAENITLAYQAIVQAILSNPIEPKQYGDVFTFSLDDIPKVSMQVAEKAGANITEATFRKLLELARREVFYTAAPDIYYKLRKIHRRSDFIIKYKDFPTPIYKFIRTPRRRHYVTPSFGGNKSQQSCFPKETWSAFLTKDEEGALT